MTMVPSRVQRITSGSSRMSCTSFTRKGIGFSGRALYLRFGFGAGPGETAALRRAGFSPRGCFDLEPKPKGHANPNFMYLHERYAKAYNRQQTASYMCANAKRHCWGA